MWHEMLVFKSLLRYLSGSISLWKSFESLESNFFSCEVEMGIYFSSLFQTIIQILLKITSSTFQVWKKLCLFQYCPHCEEDKSHNSFAHRQHKYWFCSTPLALFSYAQVQPHSFFYHDKLVKMFLPSLAAKSSV